MFVVLFICSVSRDICARRGNLIVHMHVAKYNVICIQPSSDIGHHSANQLYTHLDAIVLKLRKISGLSILGVFMLLYSIYQMVYKFVILQQVF